MNTTATSHQLLAAELAADLNSHFDQVVRTFQQPLYVFALRMTGSREEAEELTQDALIRAYRALKTYSADRIRDMALQAWLYAILRNLIRNRVRRHDPRTEPLHDGHDSLAGPDDIESGYEHLEQSVAMRALIMDLPVHHREAVLLRYLSDLSYGEMSAVLGRPEGTLKAQVHRGLAQLRERLEASSEAWDLQPAGNVQRQAQHIRPGD